MIVDSKTCVPKCHNINQMMKYEGYPNFDPFRRYFNKNYWERPSTKLFMTFDIKLLKPVLAELVTWHDKEVFQNLILVVLYQAT